MRYKFHPAANLFQFNCFARAACRFCAPFFFLSRFATSHKQQRPTCRFLYQGEHTAKERENQNIFMVGKVVLTRLCHGLTPAVQLLEKLFYLHTLNDLLIGSFVRDMWGDYYIRHLPLYYSSHRCSLLPLHRTPQYLRWRRRRKKSTRKKVDGQVAWIQSQVTRTCWALFFFFFKLYERKHT